MRKARALSLLAASIAVTALFVAHADDVVDPSIAKTIAVGDGGAIAATDRGSAGRTGRAKELPYDAKLRWSKNVNGRVDATPVVSRDGTVFVMTSGSGESTLHVLSAKDGAEKATAKFDLAAAGPIVLANGLAVVVTQKGDAIGLDAAGKVHFRTNVPTDSTTVPNAGLVPLPGGGFGVSRRTDLFELDGEGEIAGHVRVDTYGPLAARSNGEIVATSNNGDLWAWRAGKTLRLVGTFGDKSVGGQVVCPHGVVVDGEANPSPGQRRDRAICVIGADASSLIEGIDLATGTKHALLAAHPPATLFVPFRTSVAIGVDGELAVVGAGGSLMGLDAGGAAYGPVDLPGAAITLSGKIGGAVYFPNGGEIAPLVADDGSVLYGSSDGIAVAKPGLAAKRIALCSGSYAGTVKGVNVAGPSSIVFACTDGHVELVDAIAAPIAPPSPSSSASAP